ncbi:MAG: 2-oxo acid dehydrogenase subunit E2 [Gemmatimonadetes bacterium]|nr:2-oxo acid dehydrogenase subunit E2 [Gemmatimonadota bacterium]
MTALTDILLPPDQTEGTTNTVGKWFKSVGDAVSANDPLLEITTDKVTVEIAAPHDGVLAEILKPEGEAVEPGEPVGRLRARHSALGARHSEAAAPAPPPPSAETRGLSAEDLSPAVRRLLKERGIDPGTITGTGRGGRITVEDVEAVGPATVAASGSRMVPHSAMRKSIAAHLSQSMAAAPHVTTIFEADLSAVLAHRAATDKAATFTAYFVQATVAALRAVPEVNSRWHDQALELFEDCNIGIGTALKDGGLIVPVIQRAETLNLVETAGRLADLTARARSGGLTPKDVQGGTFTISNHGVSGSLVATPIIINRPQSAILGIGKIEKRAVVVEGDRIVAKPKIYVTLTIDHRVLDGFQANAFLTKWVETIESSW